MYCKVLFTGHLGQDPEMRYLPSGSAVTNMSVATSRKYTKSDGEQVEETVWFRVSAFGRMAETANQYLHKGSKVLVEGRLNPDPETGGPKIFTRNNGDPGASYEIVASLVEFLDRASDNGGGGRDLDNVPASAEDDIPF